MNSSNNYNIISTELSKIHDLIKLHDIEKLKIYINDSNINSQITHEVFATPLVEAAINYPDYEIVKFLLEHDRFEYLQNNQLAHALNLLIKKYIRSGRNSEAKELDKKIILLLLSYPAFHSPFFSKTISLQSEAEFDHEQLLDQLVKFFLNIRAYSVNTSGADYHTAKIWEIYYRHSISVQFGKYKFTDAEKTWKELSIESLLSALTNKVKFWNFSANIKKNDHDFIIKTLANLIEKFEEDKAKKLVSIITPNNAFNAALEITNAYFMNPVDDNSHKILNYLHKALSIAEDYEIKLDEDTKLFLLMFRQFYPYLPDKADNYKKRINKRLLFISQLLTRFQKIDGPARRFLDLHRRSEVLCLQLLSIYMQEVRTYHAFNPRTDFLKKYERDIKCIAALYGLTKEMESEEVYNEFEKIGLEFKQSDSLRSFNAYLMSLLTQQKMLIELNTSYKEDNIDAEIDKTAVLVKLEENVLNINLLDEFQKEKNRKDKLYREKKFDLFKKISNSLKAMTNQFSPCYSKYYQTEILYVMDDLIKAADDSIKKFWIFESLMKIYKIKVLQIAPADMNNGCQALINYLEIIYRIVEENGLYDHAVAMETYLQVVMECYIETQTLAINQNIAKKISEILNYAIKKGDLHFEYKVRKVILDMTAQSKIKYDVNILSNFVSNFYALEKLDKILHKKFNATQYFNLFRSLGDKSIGTTDKVIAYGKAVQLGDIKSVIKVLEIELKSDDDFAAIISVLRGGLKKSLITKNAELTYQISDYLKKNENTFSKDENISHIFEEFKNLTQQSVLFFRGDYKLLVTKHNFIFALIELNNTPKNIAASERSLYLAIRLLLELTLSTDRIESLYGLTQCQIADYAVKPLEHINLTINSTHELSPLAADYLNLFIDLKTRLKNMTIPHFNIDALILQNSAMTVRKSQVKSGMIAALEYNQNYIEELESYPTKEVEIIIEHKPEPDNRLIEFELKQFNKPYNFFLPERAANNDHKNNEIQQSSGLELK